MLRAKSTDLVICDLDNTIYDWFEFFVPAFYAMIEVASHILSVSTDRLLTEMQAVHKANGDVERPFALLQTNIVKQMYPDDIESARKALDPAFYAFNKLRKDKLRLYDGVAETIQKIRSKGIKVVAHSDSRSNSVSWRLKRLGVPDLFERIFARAASLVTTNSGPSNDAHFPFVDELDGTIRKPNPKAVLHICSTMQASPSKTAYVGDSVSHDIAMAKAAGSRGIWAKYGVSSLRSNYKLLERISHWTDEDIRREHELRERAQLVEPDYILDSGFWQLEEALALAGAVR